MYSVDCNLESPGTQFSAIQMRVSTSSLSGQRFKGYRCKSDKPLYKWTVTLNYANSPFKYLSSLDNNCMRWQIYSPGQGCGRHKNLNMSICKQIFDQGSVNTRHTGVVNSKPVGEEVLELQVLHLNVKMNQCMKIYFKIERAFTGIYI